MSTKLDSLLLSEAEMSAVLGIGRKSLTDLRLAGKVEPTQAKPIRYAAGPTIRSEFQRLRDVASARVSEVENDDSNTLDPIREGSLLKRRQREILEIKLAEARGEVTSLKTVVVALEAVVATTRTQLMGLSKSLAARLHGLSPKDVAALDETVNLALQDLADNAQRIPDEIRRAAVESATKAAQETAE